jgi:hypothetical protein
MENEPKGIVQTWTTTGHSFKGNSVLVDQTTKFSALTTNEIYEAERDEDRRYRLSGVRHGIGPVDPMRLSP